MNDIRHPLLHPRLAVEVSTRPWTSYFFNWLFALLVAGPTADLIAGTIGDSSGYPTQMVQIKFREGVMTTEIETLLGSDLYRETSSIKPVFTLPGAELQDPEMTLGHLDSHRPNLQSWFEIHLNASTDPALFLTEIRGLDVVEFAEIVAAPIPMEMDSQPVFRLQSLSRRTRLPAVTSDFTGLQGYLGPATEGIDALFTFGIPGGNGEGVTIYDIEYSWNRQHEDLSKASFFPLLVNPGDFAVDPFTNNNHGTAVIGEMIADNNDRGITGIAWGADIVLVPTNTANLGYNPANAIALAVAHGSPGDVILLEQQAQVCGLPAPQYGPVEWIHSVFEAIQLAVARGFVVIEAAGNGGVDLDQPACANAFDRKIRDSGAIIVGAGEPPIGADREAVSSSTFGTRVDLQGWGFGVMTTGYGFHATNPDDPANPDFFYTANFNGTSSAAAMVAGAAAILQGIELEQSGKPLTSQEIRRRLVATGSPQLGDTRKKIGPRPDLEAGSSFQDTTGCGDNTHSLWPSDPTPSITAIQDPSPIEVGLKFRSDVDGVICGLRFYKAESNTGVHIGRLWSASGESLANVIFSNETASGWQSVEFGVPVSISANQVYVASYQAPAGQVSMDENYFASEGVTSGPLHALSNAESGGNGVQRFGSGGLFPTQTVNSRNYWVDVIFASTAVAVTGQPNVTSVFPPSDATQVDPLTSVTAVFDQSLDPASVNSSTIELHGSDGLPIDIAISYADAAVTLTPMTSLTYGTTYTVTLKGGANGIRDIAGNPVPADFQWQFTTKNGPICSTGVSTIWPESTVPALTAHHETSPVELGVKFRADVDGLICGIRFYKHEVNNGTHVGNLWDSTGQLLATAEFVNETSSGWQQVNFANPVAITADTTYIASYHAPNGGYSFDFDYFDVFLTENPPLSAIRSSRNVKNGVYRYGPGGFPSESYRATNYWVDVVFVEPAPPNSP